MRRDILHRTWMKRTMSVWQLLKIKVIFLIYMTIGTVLTHRFESKRPFYSKKGLVNWHKTFLNKFWRPVAKNVYWCPILSSVFGQNQISRAARKQRNPSVFTEAFISSIVSFPSAESYLICWLASLRILSTSLPLSSSSLVRVLMFSLSVWIWWSSWAMWFFLRDTSSCSSVIRPNSSRSWDRRKKKESVLFIFTV